MVVRLNCKKSEVIVRGAKVNSRTSGITIYHSPEYKQAQFLINYLKSCMK